MLRISFLLFLSVTLIPFVVPDFNVFDPNQYHIPENNVFGVGDVREECIDSECDKINLLMGQSPHATKFKYVFGKHNISMMKTFTLKLSEEESCRFYITNDVMIKYAVLRVCEDAEKKDKQLVGTFFNQQEERFDFEREPVQKQVYFIMRASRTKKDDHRRSFGPRDLEVDHEDRSVPMAHVRDEPTTETWIPDLGKMNQPVIELFIGIDDTLFQKFDKDTRALIRHVATVVNSADALWNLNRIRIKWVGLRFWKELGFVEGQPGPHILHLQRKYEKFIFGFEKGTTESYNTGVMDYKARRGPERIPGTPDATITLFHRNYPGGYFGVASQNYDAKFGSSGVVALNHGAALTLEDHGFKQLHYFSDSVTLAHEVGHIMYLLHPVPGDPECNKVTGICIMHANKKWISPRWIKVEQEFFGKAVGNGTYQFMWKQNCRHHDLGTVHKIERQSTAIICFKWFLLLAVGVTDGFISVLFYRWWRNANRPYLPMHRD